jgi:hypothetical protein
MKNLKIEKTKYTLEIDFDGTTGNLNMSGSSYPENAIDFYKPITDWIETFIKEEQKPIILNFRLNYLNTSSTKCILDVFEILEEYNEENEVTVNWYYEAEDEDILETGEEMGEDMDIPMNFIPVKGET